MSVDVTPPRDVGEDPVLVRVSHATVGWGRTAVLSDVSFTLRAGDGVALVGPNGSGKSTLVRALLGLSPPISGTVQRSPRWRAGYVPQRENVETLLRLRAEEVVSMAASISAWLPFASSRARRDAASHALDAVGMGGLARHVFRDLSGGQRQRVVLARALASDPTVLVLDEPTNGLDLRAEKEILDLIRRLRNERGMACILVTHALHVVAREDLTVGLLHQGNVRFGPPAEILARERLEALYGEGVRVPDISDAGRPELP